MVSREELMVNALKFTHRMGFFNPFLFSEIYFFLHNQGEIRGMLVKELCAAVRSPDICRMCTRDRCIWKQFFLRVNRLHLERAPPCVRNAYFRRKFWVVLRYFSLDSPSSGRMKALKCEEMRNEGLCSPDSICKLMWKEEPALYPLARVKAKIAGEF